MNMKQFKNLFTVSVIMPAYNAERTIAEAINSVLNQTFSDFELIICNDASTDKTVDILNNIADTRVKTLHNLSNLGEGPTRDRAIDSANGVWIAVIDADDTWDSERLETLLCETDRIQNRMIFDDILECHDTPSGLIPWNTLHGRYAFGGNGATSIDVPIEHYICSKRMLIKPLFPLSLVRKYQIRHSHKKFGEDTEFFLRLLSYGLTLRYIPKPMYHYRITPGSATALSSRARMMREILEKAIGNFENAPSIQNALRKKISMVSCEEQYMVFVRLLKNKEFQKALQISIELPWILPEFIRRSGNDIIYHIHRIRHGGRTRGIR